MTSSRTTALVTLLLLLPTVLAETGAEDPPDENDLEQLMAVLDHHIQEAGNQTNETEAFLAQILEEVWAAISDLPGYEDVVCYQFRIEPLGDLFERDVAIDEGKAMLKVAGYSYDTSSEDGLKGPGYHTFNIDLNNQLLCPIVLPPSPGAAELRLAVDPDIPVEGTP